MDFVIAQSNNNSNRKQLLSDQLKKSPELISIAVAELIGRNVSGVETSVTTDFIRSALVGLDRFKIISRENMEIILAEQGFQSTGCTDQECAVKMGALLNAKKIVIGSLSKLEDVYYININLVEVDTGEINYSGDIDCSSPKQLKNACETLISRMVKKLSGEVVIDYSSENGYKSGEIGLDREEEKLFSGTKLSIKIGSPGEWMAYKGFEKITEGEFFKITGFASEAEKARIYRENTSAMIGGGAVSFWAGVVMFCYGISQTKEVPYEYISGTYEKEDADEGLMLLGLILGVGGLSLRAKGKARSANWAPYYTVSGIAEKYNRELRLKIYHKEF